ncbi:outer membrane beta-barrel protein [uncultured Pseudoxanthomonas sp.]|uniref:outer membrane beta-barrel protein n=1 Tax=uncultured Pseudoxanthomonas sp. TaxID=281701 RepID=UPI00261790AF|nr:outer membrane beta-barrel protein [uncultured Pseudoxanthomonas sp.]
MATSRHSLHRHLSTRRRILCAALAAALPFGAQAARLDYDVSMRYMHSDNIVLQAANEISEDILSPQVRFDLTHDSSVLTTRLRGNVQYLDYMDDVYQDDTRGEFTGELEWTLLPERLTFYARDSLSEQSVDSLAAFTPGNQQKINVFEAGPTLMARFGETMRGVLDLRYTNSWAEETETFNSDRYSAAARLLRPLSTTDTLVFNLEAGQTEYDTISEFYNYKRYDAYVTYLSELSKLNLDVSAGYSRLKPEGADGTSSALFRGYAGWQVAPRSQLSARASYQFGDASTDLIQRVGGPNEPGNSSDPVVGQPGDPTLQIIPDTFKQRFASVAYEFTGERLVIVGDVFSEQLRYLRDDSFDTDGVGLNLNARYALTDRLSLNGTAQRYRREFTNTAREDTDTIVGAGIAMRFSRHWSTQVDIRNRKRDSSVGSQDYTENVVMLSVTYYR